MAKMKYWNGTTWETLDAKDADTLDGKHAATTLTTTEKNDLAGAINEVKSSVDAHKADNVHIPKGLIAMWSGLISEIPAGWVLCDGQNGTPNLTDRFIMGATTDATINKTGGQNEVTLTVEQMPSHTHSGSTNSTGSHTHDVYADGSKTPEKLQIDYFIGTDKYGTVKTSSAGSHSHTVTIGNTGGGQPHENRPAYYTLAFIMKV